MVGFNCHVLEKACTSKLSRSSEEASRAEPEVIAVSVPTQLLQLEALATPVCCLEGACSIEFDFGEVKQRLGHLQFHAF
jgi:hypothetical protein